MKRELLLGLFIAAALELSALDFGFTLHQTVDVSGHGIESLKLSYLPGLGPWLSDSTGKTEDIYLSAFINMKYEYNTQTGEGLWRLIPELGRFSLHNRPTPGLNLEFGRLRFNDPNNLIVAGLFDGFMGSLDIGNTRLSLGTLYSGLLYRDTAKIFMTRADSSWDYRAGDTVFSFAGQRLITTLNWEAPSLFESPHGLAVNVLAQVDLNASEESLNSQYLSFKFTASPLAPVYARAGGVVGFAEYRDAGRTENNVILAVNLGLDWALPGALEDALSFGVIWASGNSAAADGTGTSGADLSLGAFRPLTMLSPSSVLSTGMAGLAVLRGSYTLRLRENFSLGLDGRYFFRVDPEEFDILPLTTDRGNRALGAEIYGSVILVPVSDISLVWGGGLFFPGLGNAIEGDTPPRWKTALTLAFSM